MKNLAINQIDQSVVNVTVKRTAFDLNGVHKGVSKQVAAELLGVD
jgi:hypothetical protein